MSKYDELPHKPTEGQNQNDEPPRTMVEGRSDSVVSETSEVWVNILNVTQRLEKGYRNAFQKQN